MAEIVPKQRRTLIYAVDRWFETALAACTAPSVGLLAQKVFGFNGTAAPTGDKKIDERKAKALGKALLALMVVPWTAVMLFYSGLHFTYAKDSRWAVAAEEEIGRELESSGVAGDDLEGEQISLVWNPSSSSMHTLQF